MTDEIHAYYSSLSGKQVYFLGAGVSHRALIEKFAGYGAEVTLCDRREAEKFEDGYLDRLKSLGISLRLGEGYLENLAQADLVFRSPGIDYTKPEIQKALEEGAVITSEIETFFDLCPCKTVGITGSDGKTTTTTLISRILSEAGYRVHLGGNIGDPLLPRIDEMTENDIAVVELSSFQLISMKRSPDISVVTNLSPNHLDHHADLAEYYGAKRNILAHQDEQGVAVLFDNETVDGEMLDSVHGILRKFGKTAVKNGAWFDDETLYLVKDGLSEPLFRLDELKLIGAHNRLNAAAAAAAVFDLADPEVIARTICGFTGVEHRLELVRDLDGVKYYNDSISTSPTRAKAGVCSFPDGLVLIAGGRDKRVSMEEFAQAVHNNVRVLILAGENGSQIEEAVNRAGGVSKVYYAADMMTAVWAARSCALPGETVLLSPASSSFDRYANYEERGRVYKREVERLK